MFGKMIKSLLGGTGEGSSSAKSTSVDYESFQIVAEPFSANGQWQVAGRIEKMFGEELKSHKFIRADVLPSEQDAANEMIRKAKMMIDQQGDALFG